MEGMIFKESVDTRTPAPATGCGTFRKLCLVSVQGCQRWDAVVSVEECPEQGVMIPA